MYVLLKYLPLRQLPIFVSEISRIVELNEELGLSHTTEGASSTLTAYKPCTTNVASSNLKGEKKGGRYETSRNTRSALCPTNPALSATGIMPVAKFPPRTLKISH